MFFGSQDLMEVRSSVAAPMKQSGLPTALLPGVKHIVDFGNQLCKLRKVGNHAIGELRFLFLGQHAEQLIARLRQVRPRAHETSAPMR